MHERKHAAEPARAAQVAGLDRRTLLRSAALTAGFAALTSRAALGAAPAAAHAALFGAPRGALLPPDEAGEALSLEEFFARAVPSAREHLEYKTRFGEDRYLLLLAALAVRLEAVPLPEFRRVSKGDGPGHFLGHNEAPEDSPFSVLHWKLEPGAVIRHHPHTYGSVVTVGLEGEARITNYETVETADYEATGTFVVRRTQDQILRPHDINLVPLSHGFIHGFVAGPEGARGLDVTTRVHSRQPNFGVELGETVDAARALFEARWIPGT
ncbi:MAG: hypothetical protein ACT4PU_01240 [Planctomycetota bacterium]